MSSLQRVHAPSTTPTNQAPMSKPPLRASRPTRPTLGAAMVVAAGLLFAINSSVAKLMLQGGFDSPQLTAFRAAGGGLGLLVLNLVRQPKRLKLRIAEL